MPNTQASIIEKLGVSIDRMKKVREAAIPLRDDTELDTPERDRENNPILLPDVFSINK